ncbi:MAG: hypothetical protein Nk1A_7070 [Endomicrobiia bacterium]|nr:MAG: hypothetical protein Nk1A_7070 [Endomicrobiia bacterium]
MKKLLLAVVVCCAFSIHSMAINYNAKINDIEKRINALKAERGKIENKNTSLYNEQLKPLKQKMATIDDKILSLEHNEGFCGLPCLKAKIEKKKTEIEQFTLLANVFENIVKIDKINFDIDKANIELIKAEIKAGKTPKIPLEIIEALIKCDKARVKVSEATIKIKQAKIKKMELKIKILKNIIETGEIVDEIRKNTNDSYDHIYATNIEVAKQKIKRAKLLLKLEQSRKGIAQARIKEAQTGNKLYKIDQKFCETALKFEKGVNKESFMSFFRHNQKKYL